MRPVEFLVEIEIRLPADLGEQERLDLIEAEFARGRLMAQAGHLRAIWRIPGERTKNHRPHAVPLCPQARDLVPADAGLGFEFVFTTMGYSPISGWSKTKIKLDARMNIPP